MSGINNPNRYRYQYVPPSQTNILLGTAGGPGDYLHRLVINITDPANATVSLIDGATVMPIVTVGVQNLRGPASFQMNIASREGPFRLTTGSGASVIVVGQTIGHG